MTTKQLSKPSSDNEQIRSYEQAVKKGLQSYHVAKNGQGWVVKRLKSKKPVKKFSTQSEAIVYGKQLAKNNKTSLYVRGKDGEIRERRSYF